MPIEQLNSAADYNAQAVQSSSRHTAVSTASTDHDVMELLCKATQNTGLLPAPKPAPLGPSKQATGKAQGASLGTLPPELASLIVEQAGKLDPTFASVANLALASCKMTDVVNQTPTLQEFNKTAVLRALHLGQGATRAEALARHAATLSHRKEPLGVDDPDAELLQAFGGLAGKVSGVAHFSTQAQFDAAGEAKNTRKVLLPPGQQLRMDAEGKSEPLLRRLRKAIDDNDPIAQIKISVAVMHQEWARDAEMDFSQINASDLFAAPVLHSLVEYVRVARGKLHALEHEPSDDEDASRAAANNVLEHAAERGYLPAKLDLTLQRWRDHEDNWGLAVDLLPYVGLGCREIDFVFGRALAWGAKVGTPDFYWGVKCMDESGLLQPVFPQGGMQYWQAYNTHMRVPSRHDGDIAFVGNAVWADSAEAWEAYKQANVVPAKATQPRFDFDAAALKQLQVDHQLSVRTGGRFGRHLTIFGPAPDNDREAIGQVTANESTVTDKEPAPLVKFIQDALTHGVAADTIERWLWHIKTSPRC